MAETRNETEEPECGGFIELYMYHDEEQNKTVFVGRKRYEEILKEKARKENKDSALQDQGD